MSYKLYSTPGDKVQNSKGPLELRSLDSSDSTKEHSSASVTKTHHRRLGRIQNPGAPQRNLFTEVNSISRPLEERIRPLFPARQHRVPESIKENIFDSPSSTDLTPPRPQLSQPFLDKKIETEISSTASCSSFSSSSSASCRNSSSSSSTPNLKIKVNGKDYTILKVIGKGGSSLVYEAFDENKALVAIKKVDLNALDEKLVKDCLNEVTLLQKLQKDQNERIIKLYDYEIRFSEGVLLLVMERGDTDLATILKTHVTDAKIKFYWEEMLQIVRVIHKAGIIHSDLKPANFLLVAGNLKIIDFGIASSLQENHTSVLKENRIGTFNFMSPEAIQDYSSESDSQTIIKIGFKSDVWSLGCILYSLTYGKTPFGHIKDPFKKLQAIINPDVIISFPVLLEKDPLLVDSIKRCLIRDVVQRASIEDLLSHPYLNSDQESHLNNLLSLVQEHLILTPNTISGLQRAQRKKLLSKSQK